MLWVHTHAHTLTCLPVFVWERMDLYSHSQIIIFDANAYSHTNEKEILLALPQIKNSLSSQSTKIVIWPNLLNNKSHQFLKLEAKCWNFANLYKQNDNCFKTRTQSFIFHILKAVIGQSKKLKAVKQQIWTIFLKKLK